MPHMTAPSDTVARVTRPKQKSKFTLKASAGVDELSLRSLDDKSSNSYPSAKTLRKKRRQLQDLTTEYCRRRDQQDERANDYIPSSCVQDNGYSYPENYNASARDELTEPDSLNTVEENEPSEHRQKLIKIDIENDYQSDESDHCVVLNDEFYRKANRIANNNQRELMKISQDVRTVEDELIDLSKMHRDIQDDLGSKWMRPNRKASSLSDVSKGNAPIKDDGVEISRISSRNVEKGKENEKTEKNLKRTVKQLETVQHCPQLSFHGRIWFKGYKSPSTWQIAAWLYSKAFTIVVWFLSSQISKSQLNFSSPKSSQSPSYHRNEENLCENCLVSKLPSKSTRNPSPPNAEDQDQVKRDKYKVFLEEQNYRAIQMIESRLSRLEDKMGALHSDIRHLIQAQDKRTSGSSLPTQEAPRPPPPPPLPPPPPPSSQMFFYTSTTSHSTSLLSKRSQSNPRPKSLRPSITVDDLRSVTLRKVSRDQIQLT